VLAFIFRAKNFQTNLKFKIFAMSAKQNTVAMQQGDNLAIVKLLKQLVTAHIPQPSINNNNAQSSTPEQKEAVAEEYNNKINEVLRFAIKIMESRLMPSEIELQDQVLLSERVKKKRMFCLFIAAIASVTNIMSVHRSHS